MQVKVMGTLHSRKETEFSQRKTLNSEWLSVGETLSQNNRGMNLTEKKHEAN
jgi:hypothetical protein